MSQFDDSRRGFVKGAAYVAPAILTLAAAPAFAKAGSEKPDHPSKPKHPGKPDHPKQKPSLGQRGGKGRFDN